jgi:hypothetical protein
MISVLALLALPIGFLSGGVALNSIRSGDRGMALKASGVFAVCVALFLLSPKRAQSFSSDCYIDWDGRSNPTVCD